MRFSDTHLTCPHCDYETKIRENFEAHLNSHTKKIKYICEFCKKVSYTHHAFRSHIRKKHSANKRRSSYTCVHCKHQFLTVEEMKKHTDNEHSEKGWYISGCFFIMKNYCLNIL